ncbi:MAG: hypothetical protein HYW22_00100 [Candidatus Aenigmarchaeota archaeon]|nr:hypothetical protein [Candidatus Aenigmarchaeota archaeon]
MSYRVYTSEILDKKINRLVPHLKARLEKLKKSLEENPFTGKPLKHDYLREKKWGPFRVYYLIIKDMLIVFLLEFSDKKEQQKVINEILYDLDNIMSEIKKKYK